MKANLTTEEFLQIILPICKNLTHEKATSLFKQTLLYYSGSTEGREKLRPFQIMESDWYKSLKLNKPDYSIYGREEYLLDVWACWKLYSRKYLLAIQKFVSNFVKVKSILDMGCGVGITTVMLSEVFPKSNITATNFKNSLQYKAALKITEGHNIKIQESLPTSHIDLIFASEYFEHIVNPISHLSDIINNMSPSYIIVANAFNTISIGHFDYYIVDGKKVHASAISKMFNNYLRLKGYDRMETKFWNNRPTIWKYVGYKNL